MEIPCAWYSIESLLLLLMSATVLCNSNQTTVAACRKSGNVMANNGTCYELTFHLFHKRSGVRECENRDGIMDWKNIDDDDDEKECSKQSAYYDLSLTSKPVRDLQVFVTAEKLTMNDSLRAVSSSTIDIYWKPPDSSSDELTFEIRITPILLYVATAAEECINYKLYDVHGDTSRLQLHCTSNVKTAGYYHVSVLDLSRKHREVIGSSFVVPQARILILNKSGDANKGLRGNPAQWTTDLVVTNNSCERRIEVQFELAPSTFKFVDYEVHLIIHHHDSNLEYDAPNSPQLFRSVANETQGHVLFVNVTPNEYRIIVWPVEPTECQCNCNSGRCKQSRVEEINFSIFHVTKDNCSLALVNLWTMSHAVAAVFASLTAVFVVITILIYRYLPLCKVLMPYMYSRKTVLIVYTPDTKEHDEVVRRFVDFLQGHCNVQVIDDSNRSSVDEIAKNRARYITGVVHSADKILLVISDNIRRRWLSPEEGPAHDDPGGDIVGIYLNLIQQISVDSRQPLQQRPFDGKKLVAVRFDYTDVDESVDRLNTSFFHRPVRELMKDLNGLVMDLHDEDSVVECCVIRRLSAWLFPVWYGKRYVDCPEGRSLECAIGKAKTTVKISNNNNQISGPSHLPHTDNSDREYHLMSSVSPNRFDRTAGCSTTVEDLATRVQVTATFNRYDETSYTSSSSCLLGQNDHDDPEDTMYTWSPPECPRGDDEKCSIKTEDFDARACHYNKLYDEDTGLDARHVLL